MADPVMTIEQQRDQLKWLMDGMRAECSLQRHIAGMSALLVARNLDDIGDVEDTARLANVLGMVAQVQAQRGDMKGLTLSTSELLAVLSDLADAGDEELAVAINGFVEGLDPMLVGYAKVWSRERAARGNSADIARGRV